MTQTKEQERNKRIREAVKILARITNEEWDCIFNQLENTGKENPLRELKEVSLEEKISGIVKNMGIPAHIKGYKYIKEAVKIYVEEEEEYISVTKYLYPTIARKYKTTPSRVERAIRHAIEVSWNRGNVELQEKMFGFSVNSSKGKPTNSETIATIAEFIK